MFMVIFDNIKQLGNTFLKLIGDVFFNHIRNLRRIRQQLWFLLAVHMIIRILFHNIVLMDIAKRQRDYFP